MSNDDDDVLAALNRVERLLRRLPGRLRGTIRREVANAMRSAAGGIDTSKFPDLENLFLDMAEKVYVLPPIPKSQIDTGTAHWRSDVNSFGSVVAKSWSTPKTENGVDKVWEIIDVEEWSNFTSAETLKLTIFDADEPDTDQEQQDIYDSLEDLNHPDGSLRWTSAKAVRQNSVDPDDVEALLPSVPSGYSVTWWYLYKETIGEGNLKGLLRRAMHSTAPATNPVQDVYMFDSNLAWVDDDVLWLQKTNSSPDPADLPFTYVHIRHYSNTYVRHNPPS